MLNSVFYSTLGYFLQMRAGYSLKWKWSSGMGAVRDVWKIKE
jgi:hypothetical protein